MTHALPRPPYRLLPWGVALGLLLSVIGLGVGLMWGDDGGYGAN